MSLALTDEQQMLKTAAREFFSEKQPVSALRKLRDEPHPTGFDPALWAAMSELGWAGILIAEAHGGVDFGYQGLGQIMEEAGRTLAASPLVSTVLLGGPLIRALGTPAVQDAVLPAIAAGQRVLALALDEGAHHDPLQTACRAASHPQGFVLNVPLVDGQGNWGSVGPKEYSDPPAAYRYTEARLSPAATAWLADLRPEIVPEYKPNFTEKKQEPWVLPVTFPNLLVNGSRGIGWSMACEIPPHNLAEACAAAIITRPRAACTARNAPSLGLTSAR